MEKRLIRGSHASRAIARVVATAWLGLLLAGCEQDYEARMPATRLATQEPCYADQGCTASHEALSVRVVMGTPRQALKPFPVQLRVERGQSVDSVTVAFLMKDMEMGQNRYRLIGDGSSSWLANVTLPLCVSGRSDWVAEFELVVQGRRFQARIPFSLEK